MRMLGIDYGTKKIGLAVSDHEGRVAFPFGVVKNDENILAKITAILAEEDIEGVVFGKSLDYSGKPNPVMAKIEAFKERLEIASALPIHFESEFLSSKQARNIHDSGELNDASAAAIILQSYLDKLKNRKIEK